MSPECIAKRVATRRSRGGYGHSAEVRAKISANRKGKALPRWVYEKLSAERTGVPRDPAIVAKVSAALKGRKGVSPSPETRAKLAEAARKQWATPGMREKMLVRYKSDPQCSAEAEEES